MDITKYDRVYSHEFVNALNEACDNTLTEEQKRKFFNVMYDNCFPFEVVRRRKKNEKTTFIGRLCMPLAALTLLFIRFVVMPIKYIVTGDSFFKVDSKVIKFVRWCEDISGLGWI